MAKNKLSAALKTYARDKKLTTTALAKAMGVGQSSIWSVLQGKSCPNKATIGKYATLLQISEDEVRALAGRAAAKGSKAKLTSTAGKKAKAVKMVSVKRKAKGATTSLVAAKSTIVQQVVAALTIAEDSLAQRVHQAKAPTRHLIDQILKSQE